MIAASCVRSCANVVEPSISSSLGTTGGASAGGASAACWGLAPLICAGERSDGSARATARPGRARHRTCHGLAHRRTCRGRGRGRGRRRTTLARRGARPTSWRPRAGLLEADDLEGEIEWRCRSSSRDAKCCAFQRCDALRRWRLAPAWPPPLTAQFRLMRRPLRPTLPTKCLRPLATIRIADDATRRAGSACCATFTRTSSAASSATCRRPRMRANSTQKRRASAFWTRPFIVGARQQPAVAETRVRHRVGALSRLLAVRLRRQRARRQSRRDLPPQKPRHFAHPLRFSRGRARRGVALFRPLVRELLASARRQLPRGSADEGQHPRLGLPRRELARAALRCEQPLAHGLARLLIGPEPLAKPRLPTT